MSKPELRKEWERRVAVFKASGQNQSKWCAANDLKVHQLKYWLKRIEDSPLNQERSTNWLSIAIEERTKKLDDTLQIKVGQATIDVNVGFNPSLLADVVRTLKTIC